MAVGQKYFRNPIVSHYKKGGHPDNPETCKPEVSQRHGTWIVLVSYEAEKTFFTGIKLNHCITLAWLTHPDDEPTETYVYAKGFGLVGWTGTGPDGNWREAAISEIHEPGTRPDNRREAIDCLELS